MSPVQGGGAFGQDVSLGPVIEKMRHDNTFSNEVHDPSEDEPHIVGIPKSLAQEESTQDSPAPHS
ncbi:MAG: hypothetical protein LCH96_13195 [Actinobacteria bacterium]|nr:hypothetical protein [Actinomycetota bacterium]